MKTRKLLGSLLPSLAALMLSAGVAAATPREPQVLPTVGDAYAASYDAVWDATLKSLGVLRLPVADKAAGRIETEEFPFVFVVGGSHTGNTQVIWITMRISVSRAADNRTLVQVETRINNALLAGFTPGPTNNPWADLFARIRANLGIRG